MGVQTNGWRLSSSLKKWMEKKLLNHRHPLSIVSFWETLSLPRIPCEFKCNFYVKPTKANLIQSGEYPSQCCILCIIMVSSKSQIPKSQTLTFIIKEFNRAEDKTLKSLSRLFFMLAQSSRCFSTAQQSPVSLQTVSLNKFRWKSTWAGLNIHSMHSMQNKNDKFKLVNIAKTL